MESIQARSVKNYTNFTACLRKSLGFPKNNRTIKRSHCIDLAKRRIMLYHHIEFGCPNSSVHASTYARMKAWITHVEHQAKRIQNETKVHTKGEEAAFASKDEDEGGDELSQSGSHRVRVRGLFRPSKRVSPRRRHRYRSTLPSDQSNLLAKRYSTLGQRNKAHKVGCCRTLVFFLDGIDG